MMNAYLIKEIRNDLVKVVILATFSACVGLIGNQLHDQPLPMVYLSKQARLDSTVAQMQQEGVTTQAPTENTVTAVKELPALLSLEDFKALVDEGNTLVLDARPEIFHRLGHVPGALSLPRDDFEGGYQQLKERLEVNRQQPLIIYCSGASCKDSGLIQSALEQLGYTQLTIFKGGWAEWQAAGYPEETAQ